MGWGSGSQVMSEFIQNLRKLCAPAEVRRTAYDALIPAMQNRDWDTEMDCLGIDEEYDAVLIARHPEWFTKERLRRNPARLSAGKSPPNKSGQPPFSLPPKLEPC